MAAAAPFAAAGPAAVGCGVDGACVTGPGVLRTGGWGAVLAGTCRCCCRPVVSTDGYRRVPGSLGPWSLRPASVVEHGVHTPSPCAGLTPGAVGGHPRVDTMASTAPPAADVPAGGAAATMDAGKQASAEIASAAPSKAAAAVAGGGEAEKVGASSTNGPPPANAAAAKAPAAAAAAAPVAPAGAASGAAAGAGRDKLIPPPLGGVPPRAAAAIRTDPTERRLDDAAVVQVEWYLGQVNLMNDYYLKSKMDSAYWVQLDVLLSFPKMQRLGRTDVAAFAALLRERSASVVVDPSGTRVRPAFAAAAEAAAPSTLLLTELPSPPVSAEFITTALTAADATIPTPLSVRSEGENWSITWAAPNGASRAAAALEGTTICGRAVRSSIKPVELLPPPPVLPPSPAGGSPAVYGNRGVPWNPGMDSGSPVYPGNIQPHMLVRPPYGYALHPQPGSPYTPTAAGSFQPSPHPSPVADGSYVPPPPPPPAYYAQYGMYPGHPGFDLSIGASAAGAVGATSPGLPNGAMMPGMPGVDRFPGGHAGGSGVSRPGNKRGPRADGRSGNARTPTASSAPPQPGAQPNSGGATPFTPAGRAGTRAPVGAHPSAGGENRRLGPSDAATSSGSNKTATPAASSSSATSASTAPTSSAGGRKVKKGGNRSNMHSGGSGGGPHSGNGNTGSSSAGNNRAAHNAGASAGGSVAGGAGGANAGGKDVKDAAAPVRRSGSGNTNGPVETPGALRKTDSTPLAGGKASAAAEKKPAQASVNFTATHFPPLPGLSSEEGAVPAGAASETASSRGAFAAAARRPSSAPPPTAAAPRPSPPTPPLVKEVSATRNPSDDDGVSRPDRSAPSTVTAAAPGSPSKSAPVSGAGMSYAAILRAKRPPSAPSSPKGVARPTKAGDAPSRADLTAAASSPKMGGSADGLGGSSAPSAGPVLSTSLSTSRHKAEMDGAQQPRSGSADSATAGAPAVRASDPVSTGSAAAASLEPSAAAPKGGPSSTPAASTDAGDAAAAKVEKPKAPSPAPRPVSVWANKPASVLQATAAPRPPPPPPRMAPKPTPPAPSREEVTVTKEPATTSVPKESPDQEDKAPKKEVDRPAPARSSSGSTPEAQGSSSLPAAVSEPAAAASSVATGSVPAKSTTPTSPAVTPATSAKAAPNADGILAKGAWASGSLQHALMSGSASSGDATAPAGSRAEDKATDTGAAPKAAERKADPPVVAE